MSCPVTSADATSVEQAPAAAVRRRSVKAKVAMVVSSPTPYKVPFYRRVAEQTDLDVHYYFCVRDSASRAWDLELEGLEHWQALPGIRIPLPWGHKARYRINPGIVTALARGRFDAVVVCGYNHFTMQAAMLYCIASGTPFIIQGESHVLKTRRRANESLKRLFIAPVVRRARAALATGTLARQYWQQMGIPEDRVFIVANTPDVAWFSAEANSARQHRRRLRDALGLGSKFAAIFVGRLVEAKGLHVLLDALSLLPPHGRPAVLLVGDGPLKPSLEEEAARRVLDVRFLGFRQQRDLPALYAASDFFVLPSNEEPWGVVANEAMACSLPIILSDRVGAAADLLEDGVNGMSFAAGDPAALAGAIQYVTDSAEAMRRMGQASRAIIRHWTYDASVRELEKAVRTAIGE